MSPIRNLIKMFMPILSLICFASHGLTAELQYPISFGLIRFVSPNTVYDDFVRQIGRPTINQDTLMNEGYNLVSLAGFTDETTYSSIETSLSPLSIWKRVYEIIMGNKPSVIGNTDQQIRRHIIEQQFHSKGSKILMNVDLTRNPVSRKVDAQNLGKIIVESASQLLFDGVSLDFKDYHSVKDNFASDWLQTLLKSLQTNSRGEEFLIVLIVPSTFPLYIRLFKTNLINSLVDYFVLQYYDTSSNDYTSYNNIFAQASFYQGTALFQYLNNTEVLFDICRTLIAKPVDSTQLKNPAQYLGPSSMASILMQAYNEIGWFAGIANLQHGPNSPSYSTVALGNLRDQCSKQETCVC